MRKRTWTVLLASLLVAAQAVALEPDDLVIGVGTSLYSVDPLTGALDLLSEGPTDLGVVTGIVVRPNGWVFFGQISFLTGTSDVWRLDPHTGERSALDLRGQSGLAMDHLGNLVVYERVLSAPPGLEAELLLVDPETGEVLHVIPVSTTVLGVIDIAIDAEGRVLLLTVSSRILRVDLRTGDVEELGSGIQNLRIPASGAIAVEEDGAILVVMTTFCSAGLPRSFCSASLLRIDPDTGEVQTVSTFTGDPLGVAVETNGGIVVTMGPGFRYLGPSRVVRVDPDDGSQSLVVGDLRSVGAIGVVPPPGAQIKVRPSRFRVGRGARRRLRVVLFGSEHLVVEAVDLDSLAFGPEGAAPLAGRVVRRSADAFPDLLLFFRVGQAGFRAGNTRACLEGTANGLAFLACDRIRVLAPFSGNRTAGHRTPTNHR